MKEAVKKIGSLIDEMNKIILEQSVIIKNMEKILTGDNYNEKTETEQG